MDQQSLEQAYTQVCEEKGKLEARVLELENQLGIFPILTREQEARYHQEKFLSLVAIEE